jgi:CheY-like chemotaxis protein/rubrerythrin
MNDFVYWLRDVEQTANHVYEHAALIFKNDRKLNKFFKGLAEDEAWHYHVMSSAVEFLRSSKDISFAISIDEEIDTKIKSYFSDIEANLNAETIDEVKLLEKIFEVEISEWNDLFFYVLETLQVKTNEFKYPAARIQAHLKGIETFIKSLEIQDWKEIRAKIKKVPPIWIENILIVDDDKAIADLIKALLYKTGNIEIAYNGQEALKLVENKFYKLIISDVDMPVMNGISFFNKALKKFPNINNRFLFLTGDLSFEKKSLFDECDVNYLAKPAGITKLRDIAAQILISR